MDIYKNLDFKLKQDLRIDGAPKEPKDRLALSGLLEWADSIETLSLTPTEALVMVIESYFDEDLIGNQLHQALLDDTDESKAKLGSSIISLVKHFVTDLDPQIKEQYEESEMLRVSQESTDEILTELYKSFQKK